MLAAFEKWNIIKEIGGLKLQDSRELIYSHVGKDLKSKFKEISLICESCPDEILGLPSDKFPPAMALK